MVKKEAGFIFAIIFLVSFVGVASAVGDVAYIYKMSFRVDNNIVKAFNDSGLKVDLINENALPANFNNYKLIFVGDERFNNLNKIPINQKPSIVVNYYHATDWGLTDSEGVSLLAATHPLSVRKDGKMIQVYTRAIAPDGKAIQYYYLDIENVADGITPAAYTETTSSGSKFGEVIAYANPGTVMTNGKTQGGKLCFFGIVESNYWTAAGKNLFNDCLGFVASQCTTDSDCHGQIINGTPYCQNGDVYRQVTQNKCVKQNVVSQCLPQNESVLVHQCQFGCSNGACIDGIHDIALEDFTSAVGKIRLETTNGTDVLGNNLMCNEEYEIGITVENKGNFSENATFNGNVDGIIFSHIPIDNMLPGAKNLKTRTVNFNLSEGNYSIRISAIAEKDDDLSNNNASREIVVSCPTIRCNNDTECDDLNSSTEDKCINPGTRESKCENNPIKCFTNSDCGIDGFIGNNSCVNKNVTRDFKSYTCNNPGTAQSTCTSRSEKMTIEVCADICLNGECKGVRCNKDEDCNDFNPLTKDECINPGTLASECRNSELNCASNADCGFTGFVGTEFCSGNNVLKNFQNATCLNAGTPKSSCSIEVIERNITQCENSCSQGACVRCNLNIDCNDGDANTQDICNNPGTVQSFCTNQGGQQGIACSSDSQCGANQTLSQPFCSLNNVNQLTRTWHCLNPNTTMSFCSSSIVQQVVQQCNNLCSDGRCMNIRCFNNGDCNDNNPNTVDICNNPGTEQSYCTNNNIRAICYSDSDCGIDGFISQNICSGNAITRLFQDYTCNNPGTSISFCSSMLRQDVIQTCGFACSNGQCIQQQGECTPGQTRACGFSDMGECKLGSQTCQGNGFYGSCVGAVNPTTEICNNVDDNCNGQVDEGNVCVPQCINDCNNGDKRCSGNGYQTCGNFDSDSCLEWSSGVTNCAAGQICSSGQCVSQCIPITEICNNVDDNCNGQIDEGNVCVKQCDDGLDNDHDGFIDYPTDPGCSSRTDNSELPVNTPPPTTPQCDDGIDNDHDGKIDYPADPGCSSRTDNNEAN